MSTSIHMDATASPSPSTAAAAVPAISFTIGDLHRGGSQLLPMVTDLAQMHACAYCMLRFVNIKQQKAYQQTPEWLQSYTRTKLDWPFTWSVSGCPLCLGILGHAETYWREAIEPTLRHDQGKGEWKYEIEKYTLNISEPVLARIRQYALNIIFRPKYSRLQNGYIDLKDAIKWQTSHLITTRTPGGKAEYIPLSTGTAASIGGQTDFGFLLTFTSDVPDQEYNLLINTLPRAEREAAKRAPGDFSVPQSNNPSLREYKQEGLSQFKKRGKKNPKQDALGMRTVNEGLPKIKPEQWAKLDMFKHFQPTLPTPPVTSEHTPAAAASASSNAMVDVAPAATPAEPAAASSEAMDTSATLTARPGVLVPQGYSLPLTVLVPPPMLLLSVHREPILIGGSYRKFYRFLSQSIWKIGELKQIGSGQEQTRKDALAQKRQGASVKTEEEKEGVAAGEAAEAEDDPDHDEREDDDIADLPEDDENADDGDDDDCGGRRMTDSSVEEEIVRHMLQHFEAKEYKFHSSGREDMDVRMLGNGRQFFIEFIEAKKVPKGADFYSTLQATINANSEYVEVLNLHLSNKQEFTAMKRSVSSKKKTYRCVVWMKEKLSGPQDEKLLKLNSIKDLIVQQKTPIRVLHRRSLLTRPKTIYAARCEYVNSHFFYLDLVTSSGTYVKEFVHGDRGRTEPNVGTLTGTHAEILQLDVIGFDSIEQFA